MKVNKEHFLDDITPYGGECCEGDLYEVDFEYASYWFRAYVDEPRRLYFWKKTIEGKIEPLMDGTIGEVSYLRECVGHFRRELGFREFRDGSQELDLSTLPDSNPLAAELYARVRSAWAEARVPGEPILREEYKGSMGARDTWDWLKGLQWDDEAWRYDGRMDVECPFYYLTPEAGVYYLGGYLIEVLECFYEGIHAASALLHLTFVGKEEEFDRMIGAMSAEQREACLAVMGLVAAQPEIFKLSAKELEGLTVMLDKLGA